MQIYIRLISFKGVKCPYPDSISNGKVTPDFEEYLYRDYIYVRCNPGYKLMMVRLKIMVMVKPGNLVVMA